MSAKAPQWEDCANVINAIEPAFNNVARIHNAVDFKAQAEFALAILKSNPFLAGVAYNNQDSLREAIINVADVGLSLSPVSKLAYLVPRDNRVCMDVGFRGFTRLAIDGGIIVWAKPELVYDNDEFEFTGVHSLPIHKYNPFQKRGQIIGGYCASKTPDGAMLVDYMGIAEIMYIRDTYSPSYQAYLKDRNKLCSWVISFEEMCKKTLIRRSEKIWPHKSTRERLDRALAISLDADGYTKVASDTKQLPTVKSKAADSLRKLLKELQRAESSYIEYLSEAKRRPIKSLEDLNEQEAAETKIVLTAMLERKVNNGGSNENAG